MKYLYTKLTVHKVQFYRINQKGFGFIMIGFCLPVKFGPVVVGGAVVGDTNWFEQLLKRSKPLFSGQISFLSSGFGPEIPIFSMCWCWDRIAKRLTWTGIGTTILFPVGFAPRCPRLCEVRPALTRFHLARRFWNHIFTWTSLNFKLVAIWLLSVKLRYFFAWNSLSNSRSCSDVKAVLRRRDLELLPLEPFSVSSSPVSPLGSIDSSSSELPVSDCSISVN